MGGNASGVFGFAHGAGLGSLARLGATGRFPQHLGPARSHNDSVIPMTLLLRQGCSQATIAVVVACLGCSSGGDGGGGPSGDVTPPAVSLTGPSGNTNNPVSLRGSVSEPESNASYTLALNGTTVRSGSEGNVAVDTSLANGTYTALLQATSEGGTTEKTLTFNVSPAPLPPTLNSLAVVAPQAVALQGDTLALSALASNAESTTLDVSTTPTDPDYSASGNAVSGRYAATSGFTLTGRAKRAGFSDGVRTQGVTVTPLGGTLGASKTNPTVGESIQFNVTSLPPGVDSAVVRVDGGRVGVLSGNGSLPYTPGTSGTQQAVLTEHNAAATHSESPLTLNVQPAPQTYRLTVTLREFFGDSVLHSPATLRLNGTTYTAINGVITVDVLEGVKTIDLITNSTTYNADRWELPSGDVKILFARLPQDTLNVDRDITAIVRRPSKTDADFNDTTLPSYAAIYDNVAWGHRVPQAQNQASYINTSAASGMLNCLDMPANVQDTWRAVQQQIQQRFGQYYTISLQEGTTPPTTIVNGLVASADNSQSLCNFNVGSETSLEGPNHEIVSSMAYNGSTSQAVGRVEAFVHWAGALLEDNNNRGFSFFDRIPVASDLTPFDLKAIQLGQGYARPAGIRRVATSGATPFFSLRP